MSNLEKANKALAQIGASPSPERLIIEIRGNKDTFDRLKAIGQEDLISYFIPKALGLGPDAKVKAWLASIKL